MNWDDDSRSRVVEKGLENGSDRARGEGVGSDRAREIEIPDAVGPTSISSERTIVLGSS